jgi:hypothetical protein
MWAEEVLESLRRAGTPGDPSATERGALYLDLTGRIEEALSKVSGVDELKDLLAASSLLLREAAHRGALVLPDLARARAGSIMEARSAETSVIGLGDLGREVVLRLKDASHCGVGLHRFVLEIEGARPADLDEGALRVVLEGGVDADASPRYGDMLRAAYRAASGSKGLPPLLADSLLSPTAASVTVHVVAGIEDPWIALVPDLLFDLRSSLAWGKRGRAVLHLLTRPFPRLRGTFRAAVEEIEMKKPFDDAFVISGGMDVLAQAVERFIRLGLRVPEILIPRCDQKPRGAFSSYGVATAPEGSDETVERYIARLDRAFRSAVPSWVPADAVLGELASEQVFFVHPADLPPPGAAWRLCPELIPVGIEGADPVLARIQRGLKLADLKLL